MIIFLSSTANLGDFLNAIPVMAGIVKSYNEKMTLLIRPDMKKFNGIIDFLKLQEHIFDDVAFADRYPILLQNSAQMSSWTREDKNNQLRPTETCRYENFMKDTYGLQFDVDDDVELIVPDLKLPVDDFYIGDRWSNSPDPRRADHQLSNLKIGTFLNYSDHMILNAYRIKYSPKPFIACFTGVPILADLMKKETLVVWKPEDFAPEFRRGENDIWWDNKNINQVFQKHYYGNRKARLIHARDLKKELENYEGY